MTTEDIKKLCDESYSRGGKDALISFRDSLYLMLVHSKTTIDIHTVITLLNKMIGEEQ